MATNDFNGLTHTLMKAYREPYYKKSEQLSLFDEPSTLYELIEKIHRDTAIFGSSSFSLPIIKDDE